MRLKYVGGRSHYKILYNRKSYNFTPENKRILDIQEKEIINYIFGLPNRVEFEVVSEESKVEELKTSLVFDGTGDVVELKPNAEKNLSENNKEEFKCSLCGFISKTGQGSKVHFAKHKREEKK